MDDTEYFIRDTEYARMKAIAERFADQLDEIDIVLCSLLSDTEKVAKIRHILSE
jgi:hypothetical protein